MFRLMCACSKPAQPSQSAACLPGHIMCAPVQGPQVNIEAAASTATTYSELDKVRL